MACVHSSCMRVVSGTLFRFDSVTEIVEFCRDRHATQTVRAGSVRGEFVLSVAPADGPGFESLIVHFEGEGCYAVMLPDVAAERPSR